MPGQTERSLATSACWQRCAAVVAEPHTPESSAAPNHRPVGAPDTPAPAADRPGLAGVPDRVAFGTPVAAAGALGTPAVGAVADKPGPAGEPDKLASGKPAAAGALGTRAVGAVVGRPAGEEAPGTQDVAAAPGSPVAGAAPGTPLVAAAPDRLPAAVQDTQAAEAPAGFAAVARPVLRVPSSCSPDTPYRTGTLPARTAGKSTKT